MGTVLLLLGGRTTPSPQVYAPAQGADETSCDQFFFTARFNHRATLQHPANHALRNAKMSGTSRWPLPL
jgi:hypothetical protein